MQPVTRECECCGAPFISLTAKGKACSRRCQRTLTKRKRINAIDLPQLQLLPAPLHEHDVPVSVLPRILPEGSSPQEKA
jgi:predicted nucleic acid-binding Zn ribbon protein